VIERVYFFGVGTAKRRAFFWAEGQSDGRLRVRASTACGSMSSMYGYTETGGVGGVMGDSSLDGTTWRQCEGGAKGPLMKMFQTMSIVIHGLDGRRLGRGAEAKLEGMGQAR